MADNPRVLSSDQSLRFSGHAQVRLSGEHRAVLSALLRRIALFGEPSALAWLSAWHERLLGGGWGRMPAIPDHLAQDLTDTEYGLGSQQLQTLGIGDPADVGLPRRSASQPLTAHAILGSRLRALRSTSGISVAEAARHVPGKSAGISRIETGQGRNERSDIERLLTLYRVPEDERLPLLNLNDRLNEDGWHQHFGDMLDDASCSALVLEDAASLIWSYGERSVPALLQTRAYAQAATRRFAFQGRGREVIELQLRRQRRLLDRPSTNLWAIANFSSLVNGIADPDVMREQILFLLSAASMPHVCLQVLMPSSSGWPVDGSFDVLRLPGRHFPDVVHLSGGRQLLSRPAETEPYLLSMAAIGLAAAQPEETTALLHEALRRIDRHTYQ